MKRNYCYNLSNYLQSSNLIFLIVGCLLNVYDFNCLLLNSLLDFCDRTSHKIRTEQMYLEIEKFYIKRLLLISNVSGYSYPFVRPMCYFCLILAVHSLIQRIFLSNGIKQLLPNQT